MMNREASMGSELAIDLAEARTLWSQIRGMSAHFGGEALGR